jgi:hypothetical protein
MASGQPFASRSFAGTKIPDRSVNANALPFSASSFSRHRGLANPGAGEFGADVAKQTQQNAQPTTNAQSHGPAQDTNPLNRLTEEQREEINEAVRDPRTVHDLIWHYNRLHPTGDVILHNPDPNWTAKSQPLRPET